jgi:putative FmdB family regulatory protein
VPTYQYACTECGERLEAVQSFSDPALTVCPACQGRLRKVFNSVGIVFKGSGFYRNDSRAGDKAAEKANGAAATADSAKGPEAAKSGADSSKSGSDSGKSGSDSKPTPAKSSDSSSSGSAKAPAATP